MSNRTQNLDVGLLIAAAGFGTSGELAKAAVAAERSMLKERTKPESADGL